MHLLSSLLADHLHDEVATDAQAEKHADADYDDHDGAHPVVCWLFAADVAAEIVAIGAGGTDCGGFADGAALDEARTGCALVSNLDKAA